MENNLVNYKNTDFRDVEYRYIFEMKVQQVSCQMDTVTNLL